MKKFLLFIVTMVYLGVSSGIAMDIHYCMGDRAGVDFYQLEENKKCGKCGMTDKKSGCCKDEHKFYKYDNGFKLTAKTINAPVVEVILISHFAASPSALSLNPVSTFFTANDPPGQSIPIFLRNRNFRL